MQPVPERQRQFEYNDIESVVVLIMLPIFLNIQVITWNKNVIHIHY